MKAGLGEVVRRLISIADEPTDDEDLRLRKRVGVAAGYAIAGGGLALPVMSQGLAIGWIAGLTMGPGSAINLAVLARTKRFDRYVVVLILGVTLFPAFVNLALGGMEGSSGGFVFAFVGPMFAILALGPRRATAWLIVYLVLLLGLILLDPLVRTAIAPQPYELRLIFYASNFSAPVVIVFFLLRYTELKRREAQALADDLLTNAIPITIAARLKRGERRIAEVYPDTTVCSPTSPASRRGRSVRIRRSSSASWTTCSADSTRWRPPMASRRSRPSATRTWPSRAPPSRGRSTPRLPWRWRAGCWAPWRRCARAWAWAWHWSCASAWPAGQWWAA